MFLAVPEIGRGQHIIGVGEDELGGEMYVPGTGRVPEAKADGIGARIGNAGHG